MLLMHLCAAIHICTFYVGAAFQIYPHHLHMARYSGIYQRCVSDHKISISIVFGVFEQNLYRVYFSGFSSDKQLLADL